MFALPHRSSSRKNMVLMQHPPLPVGLNESVLLEVGLLLFDGSCPCSTFLEQESAEVDALAMTLLELVMGLHCLSFVDFEYSLYSVDPHFFDDVQEY